MPVIARVDNMPADEETGHYVISVGIKHVIRAEPATRGGVSATERVIEDLLTTTVKATTLPEAIRRAKAIIDVAAAPPA